MDQDPEFHSNSASEPGCLVRAGEGDKNDSKHVICPEIMPRIYKAIKSNNVDLIKLLLKQKQYVDNPVQFCDSLGGYTILHIACMEGCYDLVKSLIFEFKANVNKMAFDGARPIMLAVLFHHHKIVELLLNAGADANDVINDDLQIQYPSCFPSPEDKWCCIFRSKMTLVAYAVIHDRVELLDILIRHKAGFRTRSSSNKTLLMCAVNQHQEKIVKSLVKVMSKDDINARDNDGFTAIYYLVKMDRYKCRCAETPISLDEKKWRIMFILYRHGTDINYMINGDPATLLINMAAQHRLFLMVKELLLLQTCSENSKPLFYFAKKRIDPEFSPDVNRCCRRALCTSISYTLEMILNDILIRQRLNLPVLKEEVLVMEDLAKELPRFTPALRRVEKRLDQQFNIIKRRLIKFGDQSMSIYDILTSSNRKFAQLASDESFNAAIKLQSSKSSRIEEYFRRISLRLHETIKRMKLLNECKNISYYISKAFHSLPFYCILDIIDYLPYDDIQNFIVAFYLK